jgi:SAM-dependent methyltransferase
MKAEFLNEETQQHIYESLETLSMAGEYYRWLCSRVSPYIRGRVLEIGAGIGSFAQWGSALATEYHPTDVDPRLVEKLRERFPKAFCWNLFEPFPDNTQYDTIVILNVIEHLRDDLGAVKALYDRLLPGGHLIVMVPAMNFLYGSLDRAFGHFRRYDKKMMADLYAQTSLQTQKSEYVNVVGMFGWFLYGRVFKRNSLPTHLTSRFNLVLPLLKMERPLAHFAGLSLMTVGRK